MVAIYTGIYLVVMLAFFVGRELRKRHREKKDEPGVRVYDDDLARRLLPGNDQTRR